MNQENPRSLVPPRPNLGPEPWSETNPSPWPLLAMALALVALFSGAFWIIRRRRAARRRAVLLPTPALALDGSPGGQLLSLASQIRETLTTRFGASIRARTTEEISTDAVVKEALGDDHFESLIRLLSTADHWKFASAPENGQTESLLESLPHWSAWQTTLPSRPPGQR